MLPVLLSVLLIFPAPITILAILSILLQEHVPLLLACGQQERVQLRVWRVCLHVCVCVCESEREGGGGGESVMQQGA